MPRDERPRATNAAVTAAAWLQLTVICAGQQVQAGVRRCPQRMFEAREADGTWSCADCYSCGDGQMCIQHGEHAGCMDCRAGQEDQDFDPVTACTGTPVSDRACARVHQIIGVHE